MALFEKGQSGNPAGRKAGSANRSTQIARQIFGEKAKELCSKAVEMALEGDSAALKLCLERIIPRMKDEPTQIDLSLTDLTGEKSLQTISQSIMKAVLSGSLSIEHAAKLSELLERHYQLMNAYNSERQEIDLKLLTKEEREQFKSLLKKAEKKEEAI